MKKLVLTAMLLGLAWSGSAYADNHNFGKADDYGSERFAMVNQCMVESIQHKTKLDLPNCMKANGFAFRPNNRVFGNRGEKCKHGDPFHSWCWESVHLPLAMTGAWCPIHNDAPNAADQKHWLYKQAYFPKESLEQNDECMIINNQGWRGLEEGCNFTDVEQQGDAYIAKENCGGEGQDWTSTSKYEMTKDGLLSATILTTTMK